MNALELADKAESVQTWEYGTTDEWIEEAATMLRQQQAEIEDLKSANRFIQNFAEEQHKRAVALEMRELTDEEIIKLWAESHEDGIAMQQGFTTQQHYFAHLILRKASEK